MKKYETFLFLAFLSWLLCACGGTAQPNKDQAHSDLDSIFKICMKAGSLPLDSVEKYTHLAYEMARQKGTEIEIRKAGFYRLGHYLTSSHADSAIILCEYLETLPKLKEDPEFIQNKIITLKAAILHTLGRSQESLDWAFKVMPQIEASKDTSSLFRLYNNIGVTNVELNRKEEAIRWYRKIALSSSTRYHDSRMIASLNIADASIALDQMDSAVKYANIALKMAESSQHLLVNANALNILGKVYATHKDYPNAVAMVARAAKIRAQIGDPFYLVADQIQLADIYFKMGNFDKSKATALEALKIAEDSKIENQDYILYTTLINAHYGSKDYKLTAEYSNKLIEILYNNSNNASSEAFAELEVKYETAKKEQQIQEQAFVITKKNNTILAAVILIVLICLLALIIFQTIRFKQKQKLQAVILKEQDEAAKAVITAEEQERSRMSQTLHDGVGQLLSGLKMNLQALGERVDLADNELIFNNSLKLLDESVAEIRNVSHQILPNNIIRMGLGNALKSLIEKIDQNKVKITLSVEGLLNDVSADTQLMVYRILQEGINNALKHAKAHQIDISLDITAASLKASIADNGIGFNTNKKDVAGIGLSNIATRIRFLKGNYIIESDLQQGTVLKFEIPLEN